MIEPGTRFRRRLALLFVLLLTSCGDETSERGGLFADVTRQAGIDFVQVTGAYGKKYLPEIMGGGCAFLDYDMDGDQDALLINGRYWRGHVPEDAPEPVMGLYRNDGRGHFENATAEAGLDITFYGLGCAVGDYDGDDDPDLLITGVGGNRFFRNDNGHFTDVSDEVGLAGARDDYTTSAGFFDADGDGDLDLFICNYVRWSRRIDDRLNFRHKPIGRMYGPPNIWEGRHCYLYRNDGGAFTDVSKAAGLHIVDAHGHPLAKALGIAIADMDADGDMDVFVANDKVRNFLLRNRGDGTFEEIGEVSGVARGPRAIDTGGMGTDVGAIHNDAGLAIGVGNYALEIGSLYVTKGNDAMFRDRAANHGLSAATESAITFGLFFFDFDLDGVMDLFQTNGGLEPEGELLVPIEPFLQPSQLFRGVAGPKGPRFVLVEPSESGAVAQPVVGRGAAYADIDGDGDLDVLVGQIARPALLLRNDQRTGHHWLRVRLVGKGKNREAIGGWAELTAGGVVQRRQVMPARSYCSSVELPLTFGLATNDRVERLRVHWPDGTQQDVEVDGVDRILVVEQRP